MYIDWIIIAEHLISGELAEVLKEQLRGVGMLGHKQVGFFYGPLVLTRSAPPHYYHSHPTIHHLTPHQYNTVHKDVVCHGGNNSS